jgi:hypothetical protein
MAAPSEETKGPGSTRRRRTIRAIVAVSVGVVTLIALLFVPVGSSSQVIQVTPGSSASTVLTIPHAGWVSVHFDHPSGMAMRYWMQGSSGMMYDHSMMGGAGASDSYSFWSWGGAYECGAGYLGSGSGTMPVWVNATWGVL